MVPFSARILFAVAPHFCGSSIDSVSALSLLLQHCKQQLQAAAAAAAAAATAATAAANDSCNHLHRLWRARLIRTAFLLAVVLTAANYPEVTLLLLLLLLLLLARVYVLLLAVLLHAFGVGGVEGFARRSAAARC